MIRIKYLISLVAASLVGAGCLTASPFGDDLDVEGNVNGRNLARIQAQSPTPDFKFVAIGDTHDAYDATADAVTAINARDDIRFVLHAGDLTDFSLAREFEAGHNALRELNVPYLAVVGNHDAIANGAEIYGDLYGPLDFSFRYGKIKFVFFNSNALEFPGEAPKWNWLEAQHADIKSDETAIWVTHQDPSAPDGAQAEQDRVTYAGVLRANPVSLVVHGHLEEYELQEYETSTLLQCGTFQKVFTYTVVSVFDYGQRYEFEKCIFNDCTPVTPTKEER